MITKLAESITAFLIRKKYTDSNERDIIRYGMEIIISTITGWTIILIMGIVCGNVWYSAIFGLVFLILRSFTGGYHADTYLKCNSILLAAFLSSLILVKLFVRFGEWYVIEIVFLLSMLIIWKFAPVEHPYKPLSEEQKRKSKRISLGLCALLTGIENCFWIIGAKEISSMFLSVMSVVLLLILIGVKEKGYYP